MTKNTKSLAIRETLGQCPNTGDACLECDCSHCREWRKPKHTPGPWHAFIYDQTNQKSVRIGVPYSDGKDHLCAIDCSTKTEENKANARLIAAAPELLAICEAIARDSKCDLVTEGRRARLYSAIIKAGGRL